MVGGEVSGEGGVFVVEGVLEVDFEGGEGMAGGGKLMPVCNIYPIGHFCYAVAPQYHGSFQALGKLCALLAQHKYLGTNNCLAFIKGGRQKLMYCTRLSNN